MSKSHYRYAPVSSPFTIPAQNLLFKLLTKEISHRPGCSFGILGEPVVFPFYQFHLPLEVNLLVPQAVGIGHHHITSAMYHESGALILCCRFVYGQISGSLHITGPQLQSFEDINGSRRIEGIIVLIKLSKLAYIAPPYSYLPN